MLYFCSLGLAFVFCIIAPATLHSYFVFCIFAHLVSHLYFVFLPDSLGLALVLVHRLALGVRDGLALLLVRLQQDDDDVDDNGDDDGLALLLVRLQQEQDGKTSATSATTTRL